MAKPVKGQIVDGYRFLGGNPNDPSSWEETGLRPLDLPSGTTMEARAAAAQEEKGNPLAIGLGRFLDTSAMGLKQAAMEGASRVLPEGGMRERLRSGLAQLSEEQAGNTEAYGAYQRRFPMETAIGETAPYAFMSGGPLGVAAKMGGMEALRYGQPDERAARGVVGAGTGFAAGAVGNVINRYLNPPLTSTQRQALTGAREMGIQPRLSEVTRNPTIARLEDASSRVPGGAGVFEEFNRANQIAINRAGARSMGAQADATGQLSDEVFTATKQKLGRVFEAIKSVGKVRMGGRSVNPILLNKTVENAADEVIRAQLKLGNRANQEILNLAQNAKKMAGLKARIDGEAYQLWHSNLTDAAYGSFKAGESQTGQAYQKMLKSLDDAAVHSLRMANLGGIADALVATRPLYANFKLLTKGGATKAGDVNAAAVARLLRQANPEAFLTGRSGDLSAVGKYAEAFPPLRPGSQTFERQMMTDPLSVAAYGGFAYPFAKATTSPLVTGIPARLGGTTAGAILGPAASYSTRAGMMSFIKRLLEPQTPQ